MAYLLIPAALAALLLLKKEKKSATVDPQETVALALVSGERVVSVQTLLDAGFTAAAEQLKGVIK